MLRKVGSTAFSTVLFCLSISPLPLLALQLAVPTRSSDGKTVFLGWTEGTGDPETIYLQIDYGFGILIPHDRLMAQVSSHSVSFEDDSGIITSTSWADLRLSAFDDPRSGSLIGQSDTFKTLQVAQPPLTSSVPTAPSTSPKPKPAEPNPPVVTPLLHSSGTPLPAHPPPAESSLVGSGASIFTTSEVSGNESFSEAGTYRAITLTTRVSPTFTGTLPPATVASSPRSTPPTFTGTLPPATVASSPRSTPPSALIGGVLGGIAFLGLCLGLSFLYIRYRKARHVYIPTGPASVEDKGTLKGSIYMKFTKSARAVVSGLFVPIFSHPHHDNARDSTAARPLPYNEDYRHPPESKRERLHQVQRQMEEAQRLQADFQSDLERRNSRDASDNITDNGSKSDGDIERLRQQIAEMSGMIAALQVEMRRMAEEQAPPDYISMI